MVRALQILAREQILSVERYKRLAVGFLRIAEKNHGRVVEYYLKHGGGLVHAAICAAVPCPDRQREYILVCCKHLKIRVRKMYRLPRVQLQIFCVRRIFLESLAEPVRTAAAIIQKRS